MLQATGRVDWGSGPIAINENIAVPIIETLDASKEPWGDTLRLEMLPELLSRDMIVGLGKVHEGSIDKR